MSLKKIIPLLFITAIISYGQTPMQLEQYDPDIGYVYPAGAQRGTVTTVTVGGQYMENADDAIISGDGVRVSVVGYDGPLSNREALQMGNKLKEMRQELGLKEGERPSREQMLLIREKTGISRAQGQKMENFANIRRDPKFQGNPAIAEELAIELVIDPDATPGRRELRVVRDGRISGPIAFYIGQHPERTEADKAEVVQTLPVVLNGQIMPGETDRWAFEASKGDHLVVASVARELIPHLADAVPGWFQAVITLYDSSGNELAYADDHRFNPDPVLYYEIPADGTYSVAIRDSIHRGRADFIYRITLGEIPFITSIFPLGGKSGEKTVVQIQGKNLPAHQGKIGDRNVIDSIKGVPLAYPVPFAQGELPELLETEPNNTVTEAMAIQSSCTVNGRIGHPGDRDVFAIELNQGESFVAEVFARRLNSPLDSILMITDAEGQQVAINDDHEDKTLGLLTHHADSRIVFEASYSGTYHIHLADTQNAGGSDFGYRLQLGRPEPDYELRVVPSNLNGVPGASVPFTVYALRKDGFNGAIDLKLNNRVDGLRLDGARIAAGQDQVEMTITLPTDPLHAPEPLEIEGHAVISGKAAIRLAVPADDMMQAFIYHHLIPAEDIFLSNIENHYPSRRQAECAENGPLQLQRGQITKVLFYASTWFGRSQRGYELEPQTLPAGVSIEEVSAKNNVIEITLRTDASAEKGLEGNLLFNQAVEHQMKGKNQEGVQGILRISAGPLPAVPFKIM